MPTMTEPLRLAPDHAAPPGPAGAERRDPSSFEAFFESRKAGLYSALCLVTRDRYEADRERTSSRLTARMASGWAYLVARAAAVDRGKQRSPGHTGHGIDRSLRQNCHQRRRGGRRRRASSPRNSSDLP